MEYFQLDNWRITNWESSFEICLITIIIIKAHDLPNHHFGGTFT